MHTRTIKQHPRAQKKNVRRRTFRDFSRVFFSNCFLANSCNCIGAKFSFRWRICDDDVAGDDEEEDRWFAKDRLCTEERLKRTLSANFVPTFARVFVIEKGIYLNLLYYYIYRTLYVLFKCGLDRANRANRANRADRANSNVFPHKRNNQ